MRPLFLAIACIFTFAVLNAQNQAYYKSTVLKTNVFTPFNIGIEFPVKEQMSIEYNVRRIETFAFSRRIYRDERLNFKYHLPFRSFYNQRRTFYLMLGLHHEYRALHNTISRTGERETAGLNQNRLVCGIGCRYRFFDFWLATETVFFERENYYQLQNEDKTIAQSGYWKSGGSLKLGVNINFVNFGRRNK